MSKRGFLYFLAGVSKQPALNELEKLGLGYAIQKGAEFTCVTVRGAGPGGESGMIIAFGPQERVGYYLDDQVWRRVPKSQSVWVGMYTEAQPGPDDLLRSDVLDGHLVELTDGRQWLCPVARGLIEEDGILLHSIRVPQRYDLNSDGNWELCAIVNKYAELWRIAEAFWDTFLHVSADNEAVTVELPFQDMNELTHAAATALAANYRLSAVEIAMLGIFDDVSARKVLEALVDFPTFQTFVEKKTVSLQADG